MYTSQNYIGKDLLNHEIGEILIEGEKIIDFIWGTMKIILQWTRNISQ